MKGPTVGSGQSSARAWVTVRFRANMPGIHSLHCHQTTHLMDGMFAYLAESPELIPEPPATYKSCAAQVMKSSKFPYVSKADHDEGMRVKQTEHSNELQTCED